MIANSLVGAALRFVDMKFMILTLINLWSFILSPKSGPGTNGYAALRGTPVRVGRLK